MNKVYLIGTTSRLVKLPEEETYKTRIQTNEGNHHIYIPKEILHLRLKDYENVVVGVVGHVTQTLFDDEFIIVDQLAVFRG